MNTGPRSPCEIRKRSGFIGCLGLKRKQVPALVYTHPNNDPLLSEDGLFLANNNLSSAPGMVSFTSFHQPVLVGRAQLLLRFCQQSEAKVCLGEARGPTGHKEDVTLRMCAHPHLPSSYSHPWSDTLCVLKTQSQPQCIPERSLTRQDVLNCGEVCSAFSSQPS